MSETPTLAEQIDAVQWAESHAYAIGRKDGLCDDKIKDLRRRLEAAVETLRMLEFGRETLK